LRGVAGSAKTAMLSRFASTRFNYFDAIRPMFRFTIRDVLWLTALVAVLVAWWLQLKMRSRSAFDGILGVLYPLFFSTTAFLMFRGGGVQGPALLSAAVGASVMGVWSSTSTTAASSLQQERRQGTLELLVAAPTPFSRRPVPTVVTGSRENGRRSRAAGPRPRQGSVGAVQVARCWPNQSSMAW